LKKIVAYLLIFLIIDIGSILLVEIKLAPSWLNGFRLIVLCGIIGGIGGVVYCLRGVYLNYCVRKCWDDNWQPWYYIRPIVSHLCGAVSYLFLKAGLLLLEAKQSSTTSDLGFFAFAFIAGLNVDKFLEKIEEISQATWGIKKSRTANEDD
jgi:hypothetical protein